MVDPISLTVAIISAVGTIIIGIIQILRGGWDCGGSTCFSSDCCSKEVEIHDNKIKEVHIEK